MTVDRVHGLGPSVTAQSPAALDVTLARQNLSSSTTWRYFVWRRRTDWNIWSCILQKISHILFCALKVHNCPLLVLPLQYTAYPARIRNAGTTGPRIIIMTKKQKGFSLIELLIVVAIIVIIAGYRDPNLLRARMSANESSAVGSTRTIVTTEVQYSTTYGTGFAPTLGALGGPAACVAAAANASPIN